MSCRFESLMPEPCPPILPTYRRRTARRIPVQSLYAVLEDRFQESLLEAPGENLLTMIRSLDPINSLKIRLNTIRTDGAIQLQRYCGLQKCILLQRICYVCRGSAVFHVLADPPWQFYKQAGKVAPEHRRCRDTPLWNSTTSWLCGRQSSPTHGAPLPLVSRMRCCLRNRGAEGVGFNYKSILSGTKCGRMAAPMAAGLGSIFAM